MLCLPEPFTPANGFSCSRQTRPWRSATFFIGSAALELDSELSETEATASPSPAPEYTAIKSGTEGDDVFAMQ